MLEWVAGGVGGGGSAIFDALETITVNSIGYQLEMNLEAIPIRATSHYASNNQHTIPNTL